MEEGVLRRSVGGAAVMGAQLGYLLELAGLRHVTVQVMPLSYDVRAGLDGPLTLLETPEHKWLAYLAAREGGQLIDDAGPVSALHERFGMIRSQALAPHGSIALIERLTHELPPTDR